MGNSSPAWLAKDPAAQKHLGKYKEDPQGLVWYVDYIDTGRNGDVAKLRRAGADREVRRSVPLKKLERDYKDVAEDKQTSPDGEVCRDVELQAAVEAMSGGPVKVTAYEDTGKPNMLWDPGEVKDAGILAQLPTFFVDANPGDERPVGVVVVLGDKKVRVKVVGMKDPRDLTQEIPAIELRPLQEPGKEGEVLPAVTGGPLAVLAFRNPDAIDTFMRALNHIEKKLTGETPKFVVQFEPVADTYPCKEGCAAWQFCFDHVRKDYRCEHDCTLPPSMVEANRLVQRLLDAHATVIDEQDSPDEEQEAHFERERERVVRKLAE